MGLWLLLWCSAPITSPAKNNTTADRKREYIIVILCHHTSRNITEVEAIKGGSPFF